ncbi:MAG: ABC transporter ATP-binding protein [Dokdonella sp.]
MFFRFFEQLIDPFRAAPDTMPPERVVGFYVHYLRQVRGVLATLLAVGLVVSVIEVALIVFIGRIVDMASTAPSAGFFRENGVELAWMAVVLVLLRPLFFFLHDLLVQQAIAPNLTSLVRWQSHRYVLKQSLGFFHSDFSGRLANRILRTGSSLRESAVQAVDSLWHVLIYAGGALLLFAQADWRLMLPLILWLIGYVASMLYFVPRVKRRSTVAAEAQSRLMGRVVDGYANIGTLKLFAHDQHEQAYVRDAIAQQTSKAQYAARVVTVMDASTTLMNGLLIAATAALALWLWHQGEITVGEVTVATALVMRINNMSGWIMWVINGIFENVGTVEDGMRSISQPRRVQDQPDAAPLTVSAGAVRFEQVTFHYGGKRGPIIDGVDLAVAAGEKIGLIGPSGAGKSTLVNLLLRLYDLQGGRILIDDQDVAAVTQESLRAQIGMVTQDTALLHRSIRENLLYGRPQASEDELWAALEGAKAADFIAALSDSHGNRGLDVAVGERGVKLSGGQRQRIAIARVLLKDAPILVLDEATSALDSEVEAAIQESLDGLMQGKTVIAIAHRLSTIARMDRLVVLQAGRIAELGNHAELIERGGLYARLWQHQTGGFVGLD